MNREEFWNSYNAWVATRPECVQKLASEFPIGTAIEHEGRTFYLCGYNESDMLIVSQISPSEDYDAALANKEYVCASHLRATERKAISDG